MRDELSGPIFTATFLSTAWTGGDLLTMLTSAASRARLLGIELQQIGTAIPPMTVEIFRGTTSVGAGGASLSPVDRDGWSTRAPASAVLGPPSAGNSTAAAQRVFAGGFALGDGSFCWQPDYPPMMKLNEAVHIRTSTPGSTLSQLAATFTFQEVGKIPG